MLASILGSIFAGGATGLLGMVFQRVFDLLHEKELRRQKEVDQKFELDKRRIDVEITDKEWAGRTRVAETEAAAAKDVAETNAFAASLLKEPERYSEKTLLTKNQNWVLIVLDFARGIIRPALTVYLCALTSYVWWEVHSKLALEDLDTDQALNIWLQVVNTILYLTTTVILWWFGTRNKQRQPGS